MEKDDPEIEEINGIKYKIERQIRLKYTPEIINLLKKHKIPFEAHKNKSLLEDEISYETLPLVEIDKELYDKLKQISEITGISMKKIIDYEIKDILYNQLTDDPMAFLDRFIGIENIKDLMAIIRKFKTIVDIPDRLMKALENEY